MTLTQLDTVIAFTVLLLGISLLITILNQMIASLLGHRGMYLKDGIRDLLATLDPGLADEAEAIAEGVLTHKLASDSVFANVRAAPARWKLATSIGGDELSKLLVLCSQGKSYDQSINNILKQVNPTVERELQLLADTVNATALGSTAVADRLAKQVSDRGPTEFGRLEAHSLLRWIECPSALRFK
jgi:hypothetical protein